MIILLRQKIFFEKQKYYTIGQRIKSAVQSATLGGLVGAITLGFPGLLFGGFKGMRRGALAGLTLGGTGGGYLSWKITSNDSVDKYNEQQDKQEKLRKKIEKNPEILFEDLNKAEEIIKKFKDLERKYNVKFPADFYKLIRVRKEFIPTLVGWYKKYKDPNYTSVLMSIIPSVTESALKEDDEIEGLFIMIDPGRADDTWIVYDPNTKIYSPDIFSGGSDKNTLKEAILDYLNFEETYCYERSQKELIKLYKQFIVSKL